MFPLVLLTVEQPIINMSGNIKIQSGTTAVKGMTCFFYSRKCTVENSFAPNHAHPGFWFQELHLGYKILLAFDIYTVYKCMCKILADT